MNLSQRQVAARLGISRRTVRYVEEQAILKLRAAFGDLAAHPRSPRKCGICQRPGHTRRTCGKAGA